MGDEFDEFMAWFTEGYNRGWCSDVVCVTHDGLPSTDEEDAEWEAGGDPCVAGVRIYL